MPERVEKFQYLDSFSWSSKNNTIKNRIEDFINEEFQSKYLMRILPERVNINQNYTPIVKNVAWNKYGFVYDFGSENSDQPGALKNGIIRPSATPAVFELRNPNQDIYGRVI